MEEPAKGNSILSTVKSYSSIIHIALEVIVIGCVWFATQRKISALTDKLEILQKEHQGYKGHINNLYEMVNRLQQERAENKLQKVCDDETGICKLVEQLKESQMDVAALTAAIAKGATLVSTPPVAPTVPAVAAAPPTVVPAGTTEPETKITVKDPEELEKPLNDTELDKLLEEEYRTIKS